MPNQRVEALEYYRRVAVHRKLAINLFETVESVTSQENLYQINTSKAQYSVQKHRYCYRIL
jgi:thioredoxin reductase (NADPH)